ncbi:MAG: lipopolysaccharide heptosyltransferase family protein [Bacteroidetes bacterium]|nr:MAG: lipopolysaccharide heptosyltransferase family protein [Bacteroidota bacterium]
MLIFDCLKKSVSNLSVIRDFYNSYRKNILMAGKIKICVVRTDRLGDMVLTLPMCKALKDNCPNSEVSIIARRYVKPLLENCPVIDNVFFIDDYENGIKEIFKKNIFDVAYFPRPRLNECFSAYMNRIPLRVGTAYRYYSLLFNHKVYDHRKTAEYHEAEYNTRLVASVLKKDVRTELVKPFINNAAKEKVNNILNYYNIDKEIIIIHPGSGGSAFNWKPENFGEVSNILNTATNYNIIITGIKEEFEICEKVTKYCPGSINLCGKFDLWEMLALISLSKLLLANSTGVLHIAAALDIPVVGIYPNSPHLSPKRWGPYSAKSRVVCPPDNENENERDNMNSIPIMNVVNNSLELLNLI